MRREKRKKIIKNIVIIVILLILFLSYLYVEGIRDVVNLVVISFIVSYTLKPIRDYIVEKYRLSIRKAAMIIVLFCIASFIGIMYFMVPSLLSESRNIGGMLDNLEAYAILAAEKFDLIKYLYLKQFIFKLVIRLIQYFQRKQQVYLIILSPY
ncbi:MAG: hypothetical protein V8R03_02390 [Clostridium sp.]